MWVWLQENWGWMGWSVVALLSVIVLDWYVSVFLLNPFGVHDFPKMLKRVEGHVATWMTLIAGGYAWYRMVTVLKASHQYWPIVGILAVVWVIDGTVIAKYRSGE